MTSSARCDGWSSSWPSAASVSRTAPAPVSVAVETKIGPSSHFDRFHTGTAVAASSTPV